LNGEIILKSQKEHVLDRKLMNMLSGKAKQTAELLILDSEIEVLQAYANDVSIKRLGLNDHGPVHMKTVAINAMNMSELLHNAGIKFNLEMEDVGTYEDSQVAILLAAYLHDIGMSIGRERHEQMSAIQAISILQRLLENVYPNDLEKQIILRSLALEGIVGHMATQKIYSLEAGIILISDGCDMRKGRARIPLLLHAEARIGDIHKYSAASIENVIISKGDKRPIKIFVEMSSPVGFFQVEEVLYHKIDSSPVKSYIELCAGVIGGEVKVYL
jgi:uncharacterized protein